MVRPAQIQKQQPQVPPAPKEDKPRYLYLILVGILFLLIGSILYIGMSYVERPDEEDYETDDYPYGYDNPEYDADKERYEDISRNVVTTGFILEGIGAYILCFGLFIGAILDKKQTNHIRLAMIVAAGLIIGLKLSGIMYVLFRTAYI